MSHILNINETASLAGNISFPNRETITFSNYEYVSEIVPAAKAGQLTTRTNNTEGTLTMSSGHGITTGARLDLYWNGGQRRGITVGTVAGNAVPLTDTGSGDNLPDNLTAVIAMVPVEREMLVTGNGVKAILLACNARSSFIIAESDDSELYYEPIHGGNHKGFIWTASRNPTNPLASEDVAKVFLSHADTANSMGMRILLGFDG